MNNNVEHVWSTIEKYGVPHFEDFKKSNPLIKQHIISNKNALTQKESKFCWRNCDVNIRNWWKKNSNIVKTDFILFSEWDVKITDDITKYFDFDCIGLIAKSKVIYKPTNKWVWFSEVDRFPNYLKSSIIGILPFSVILLHRSVLDFISSEKFDDVFSSDIFCELRLPTVVNYGNFEIRHNSKLKDIRLLETDDHLKYPGMFHKVKTLTS